MSPPDYTGVCKLLYDWQSLLAGVLAVIAGIAAYCAGRRQARAVEEQNSELKRAEKRRLAREELIAVRLLEGGIARTEDDTNRIMDILIEPQYQREQATVPSNYRRMIHKPEITVVWEKLGLCDPEIISTYLRLDHKIDQFWETEIVSVPWHNQNLNEFATMIKSLRASLAKQAHRVEAVLLETQQT
jgi:hypothetical protein